MSIPGGPSPTDILYQLKHATDDRGPLVLGINITLTILAAFFVGLRLWSRKLKASKLAVDDYLIMLALIFLIAMAAVECESLKKGFGKHVVLIGVQGLPGYLKDEFAYEILYAHGICTTKFSILFFYRHLFSTSARFNLAVNVMFLYMACFYISAMVVIVFDCQPVHHFWDRLGPGHCLQPFIWQECFAALNICSDIVLLVMPIPLVWALQVSRSQKISLSAIFLVGFFVCIVSIIRARYVVYVQDTIDPTYSNTDGGLWSTTEVAVAIMCANLPILRPLLTRYILNPLSSFRGSSGGGTDENSTPMRQLPRSINKPKKHDSMFDSQASTQVMTQNTLSKSEDVIKEEEEEEEAEQQQQQEPHRGWRSFIPHKESRFVGATTQGSAMESQAFSDNDEMYRSYAPRHGVGVRTDIEWRSGVVRR